MQKKIILLCLAILIIGAGAYYQKSKASSQTTKYVTATASKGTLVTSVAGSGNIVVDQLVKVSPAISGTVTNLSVHLGDQVKKGQTLFSIANTQLDVTVGKSEAAYIQAKQSLAAAQATLATARSNYVNQSQDSGQSKAQANVDQANQALSAAQAQLSQDQTALQNNTSTNSATYATLQAKVTADQASVNTAQDSLNAAIIAQQQSQNSASANTEAARQQLAAAQNGVDAAQKNLSTALTDLNNQKANADQRTVTAPIDGTITTLSIGNGDQLSGGTGSSSATTTAPLVIADLTTLKASVQINEVDASKVQPGQKVTMTFDAIDGLTLTGKVEKIDTVGTLTQGVVTYNATIDLDSLDPRVRPQMSVSAAITIGVKQDVLTVPNAAVKTGNSGSYVQIMQNGSPVQQSVQTGSSNDTDTEITSGLNEGDVVVTQTITPTAAKSSPTTSGLGIPGGARFGGAARGGN